MKNAFISALVIVLALTLAACGTTGSVSDTNQEQEPLADRVTISFDYQKQPGYATNQFAVWIEDADGRLVKTLYATKFTANGGYKNRPDSIANWVAKSGLADMPKSEVDAITGATPEAGQLAYAWDLTDSGGAAVPDGKYIFFVEGTLRWKNYVLFSGEITVGDGQRAALSKPEFHFEADGNSEALTYDSPECGMISNVSAEYVLGDAADAR